MDHWMLRGECGPWPLWLEVAYQVAHSGTFVVYLAIGTTFARASRAPKGEPLSKSDRSMIWWLLAGTFGLCGSGHVIEGHLSFVWRGGYPFFAAWHFATFVVGMATAVALGRRKSSLWSLLR